LASGKGGVPPDDPESLMANNRELLRQSAAAGYRA
jgi:hypothetical protein